MLKQISNSSLSCAPGLRNGTAVCAAGFLYCYVRLLALRPCREFCRPTVANTAPGHRCHYGTARQQDEKVAAVSPSEDFSLPPPGGLG